MSKIRRFHAAAVFPIARETGSTRIPRLFHARPGCGNCAARGQQAAETAGHQGNPYSNFSSLPRLLPFRFNVRIARLKIIKMATLMSDCAELRRDDPPTEALSIQNSFRIFSKATLVRNAPCLSSDGVSDDLKDCQFQMR
jgi:hypothetical protein